MNPHLYEYSNIFFILTQWTNILTLFSIHAHPVLRNPCIDRRRTLFVPAVNKRSFQKRDIWEDSERFLRKFHADLKDTSSTATDSLKQIANFLQDREHIRHLEELPAIPSLEWETFHSDPVTGILQKLYTSLSKTAVFTSHIYEKLQNSRDSPEKRHILQMLREIEQGKGNAPGLYHLLCAIYRQLPLLNRQVTPLSPDLIPLDFYRDKSLANVQDDSYRVLHNIDRVLNGTADELAAILSSGRRLKIFL